MSSGMRTAKKPEWQTPQTRLHLIRVLLIDFKTDILNMSLIILFNKTGVEWSKKPTQDKCLKLPHKENRQKETERNSEKRAKNMEEYYL